LAHGMSYFLNESFMIRGDEYYMAICNKTGAIAIYNEVKNLFLSPFADGPVKFHTNPDGSMNVQNISKFGRSFSVLRIPYSFKLLIQELQTMNVQMRIITDENVDQMLSLSYSNNINELLRNGNGSNSTTNVLQDQETTNFNIKRSIIQIKSDIKSSLTRENEPAGATAAHELNDLENNESVEASEQSETTSSVPYAPGSPAYESSSSSSNEENQSNAQSSPPFAPAAADTEAEMDLANTPILIKKPIQLDGPRTPSFSPPPPPLPESAEPEEKKTILEIEEEKKEPEKGQGGVSGEGNEDSENNSGSSSSSSSGSESKKIIITSEGEGDNNTSSNETRKINL